MKVNIKGIKTPDHSKSLCDTCSECFKIKGESIKDEKTLCLIPYPAIEIECKVTECNSYRNKTTVSIEDMKRVAWIIETKGNGKTIGFIKPDQRTQKHKDDLLEVY